MLKAFSSPLVTAEWLVNHLHTPDIQILDATVLLSPPSVAGGGWAVSSNREAHDAVHVPGSHYADLN